ncbi:hypothetical protein SAMN05216483_0120 [Streptomyces sp. 2131.1]|nr:hypothetical protein SAMN05216483_0120 [Streptomyces sp. 2131.1]
MEGTSLSTWVSGITVRQAVVVHLHALPRHAATGQGLGVPADAAVDLRCDRVRWLASTDTRRQVPAFSRAWVPVVVVHHLTGVFFLAAPPPWRFRRELQGAVWDGSLDRGAWSRVSKRPSRRALPLTPQSLSGFATVTSVRQSAITWMTEVPAATVRSSASPPGGQATTSWAPNPRRARRRSPWPRRRTGPSDDQPSGSLVWAVRDTTRRRTRAAPEPAGPILSTEPRPSRDDTPSPPAQPSGHRSPTRAESSIPNSS